ncbi:LptF/LptG family permease [Candidatus Electronema sp. TJ]|uniref:LptF/LptG family permease n=1 Tax=Candidatus Electronema sp. TJ TaxID=3401573 RepID=UPI003AA8771E
MNLLNRYILKQFVKNILLLVLSFIALYILIDFFEKIDNFMEKGKPMALVAQFFLLSIPFVVEQMGPVCILLAGVVTLGVLNHSNELTALKAGGVSLRQIVTPLVAAGIAATLLLLALSQFVLPKTAAQTSQIWYREVKGQMPLGIYRSGRYYYQGDGTFYSFTRPDPQKTEYGFFSYASWNKDYELQVLIAASSAVWKKGIWLLGNGQVQTAQGGGTFKTDVFAWRSFPFKEKPADFFLPQLRSSELSILELYREALRGKQSKEEKAAAWTEFYGRVSYILLGLPLLLLGLPLMLLVYRKWGRDLSLAVPVSCGMAFACWGVWVILQSLAKAAYFNPLAAALSVHLIVAAAGLFLLMKEDM